MAKEFHISTIMEASSPADSLWLQQILVSMRDDLRGHMDEDREDLASVRETMHGLGKKLDAIRLTLDRKAWVTRTVTRVFTWTFTSVGGAGGLYMLGKALYSWVTMKVGG